MAMISYLPLPHEILLDKGNVNLVSSLGIKYSLKCFESRSDIEKLEYAVLMLLKNYEHISYVNGMES